MGMNLPQVLELLHRLEITQQCSVLSLARILRDGSAESDQSAIEMAMRVLGYLPDTGWSGMMDAGVQEYEEIMRAQDILK